MDINHLSAIYQIIFNCLTATPTIEDYLRATLAAVRFHKIMRGLEHKVSFESIDEFLSELSTKTAIANMDSFAKRIKKCISKEGHA